MPRSILATEGEEDLVSIGAKTCRTIGNILFHTAEEPASIVHYQNLHAGARTVIVSNGDLTKVIV